MSKFLKDTSFNVAGQLVVLVFTLGTSVLVARQLGAEGRGELTGILLVPTTLNALLASGFGSAIVYLTSSHRWTSQQALSRVLGLTAYLVAAVGGVATLVVTLGMQWLQPLSQALLFVGLITIPLALLKQGLQALLHGHQAFAAASRNNAFSAVAGFACTLTALLIAPTVVSALTGYLVGSTVAVALLVWSVSRVLPDARWRPELDWQSLRPAFSYGSRAHAANAVAHLNYRADQFIITSMLGLGPLGIYTVAVSLAEQMWLVAGNASAVLMPRVAASQGSDSSVQNTCQLARVMVVILAAATFGLAVFATLIPLIYSAAFRQSVPVLLALLPGVAAMGYTKIISNYVAAVGKPEINARNATIGLVVNIVANFVLIPLQGIVGAALATSLSYTTICLLCYGSFLRLTGTSWQQSTLLRREDLQRISEMLQSIFPRVLRRAA